MLDAKKAKKYREAAAKLTRPRPVELPSGKWRCQMMVKGQRIDVVDEDPTVAHAKALAIKAGILEHDKPTAALTVGQAIDRYIESKDAVLSPSTIRGYIQLRKNTFGDIMGVRLSDLTQEQIQRSVNKMARSISPKSIRNAHGLLSAALSVYRPNFTLHTTLPQKKKIEIVIPTNEEIAKLAEAVKGSEFELPFLLAAWMGLRTSEIRGLTWDCVDGDILHIKQALVNGTDGPVLKSTKSYSGTRDIRMPPYIQALISSLPKSGKYVINSYRNEFYKKLDALCKECGIRHYRFHDLRHYHASVMLALGVPDKYAMARMGHASNNMLKTVYQHTMREKTDEVGTTINSFFEENLHMNLHTK